MRRLLFFFCVFWITFAFAERANAQVNTEPLRRKILAQRISTQLDASFAGRLGNTEGIQAGASGAIGFVAGEHFAFAIASGDYSQFNDTVQVAKTFAHLRYNYELTSWLWMEAFAQAQSDQFQRLKLRNLFGIGPRFGLFQDKDLRVFTGASLMFEREILNIDQAALDAREVRVFRGSLYGAINYLPDDRIELSATAYLQPQVARVADVRVLLETAASFKLTKRFTAGISAILRYDSEPPTSVKRADFELKNTIGVSF